MSDNTSTTSTPDTDSASTGNPFGTLIANQTRRTVEFSIDVTGAPDYRKAFVNTVIVPTMLRVTVELESDGAHTIDRINLTGPRRLKNGVGQMTHYTLMRFDFREIPQWMHEAIQHHLPAVLGQATTRSYDVRASQ